MNTYIIIILIYAWALNRAIKKGDRMTKNILIGSGVFYFLFFLWIETNPLRSKMDKVFYQNKKLSVVGAQINSKGVTTLMLENGISINQDSVTSAKPRNAVSWITDFRTKYKL